MRAGSLRHRVRIERPNRTKDEYGGVTTEWVLFADSYASIEQMKSFDKSVASATWPGADSTIGLRYIPGVTGEMRVVFGDQIFSILGQPNNVDFRNRELVLTCESGVKAQ